MSERSHLAVNASSGSTRRSLLLIGGTAVALLVAGIAAQIWRANASTAAEDPGRANVAKSQAAQPAVKREAAAKITKNGKSITIPLDDVAKECMLKVGNDVLDSMINRAVIQLACEERGINITEAEVDQEIIRISKQFNIPTETWLQMLQTERNIAPLQYKRDVIWPMLALKKLAGDDVRVTDDDMHKAFVRHYGPRVKCRMIMCDNLRRANEAWQKATSKQSDFDQLVREYSIEPNSRAMDGVVPPLPRYSGSPELEEAAFKLKEGQISGIINIGPSRYAILKCEGYTEQTIQNISEVSESLRKDLVEEKVQESVAKMFEQLKKNSRIDNYWNNTTTGDVRQVSGTQSAPTEKSGVRTALDQRSAGSTSGAAPRTNGSAPGVSGGTTKLGNSVRPDAGVPRTR